MFVLFPLTLLENEHQLYFPHVNSILKYLRNYNILIYLIIFPQKIKKEIKKYKILMTNFKVTSNIILSNIQNTFFRVTLATGPPPYNEIGGMITPELLYHEYYSTFQYY